MYKQEFVEALAAKGVPAEDAHVVWDSLHQRDSGYYWTEDAAIERRHGALAYYVIRQAGEPLHWREIHERADALGTREDLSATSFYNAIGSSPLLVRTANGTYGLQEWGLKPARRQKDVIADVLSSMGRTMRRDDVITAIEQGDGDIPASSIQMYLDLDRLFYEDIDGRYGLRQWLPPPENQRLGTPRRLRESRRSRERRGSEGPPGELAL